MTREWSEFRLSEMKALLPDGITLVRDPSPADMVVCGRPTAALLHSCTPFFLLIPFAGIPPETLALMRDFRSIRVHNIHHNAGAVAETALALMLSAARGLPLADAALRRGDWSPGYSPVESILVGGSRVLILGFGHIGRLLGKACEALGAVVLGVRRHPDPDQSIHPPDDLNDLLPGTDFLVCCLPLRTKPGGWWANISFPSCTEEVCLSMWGGRKSFRKSRFSRLFLQAV